MFCEMFACEISRQFSVVFYTIMFTESAVRCFYGNSREKVASAAVIGRTRIEDMMLALFLQLLTEDLVS